MRGSENLASLGSGCSPLWSQEMLLVILNFTALFIAWLHALYYLIYIKKKKNEHIAKPQLMMSLELNHVSLALPDAVVVPVVKKPPVNAGDTRNAGLIPGPGRSPRGRHGNPLQYSFLGNPHGQRGLGATVYRVTKSQTQLKRPSMQQVETKFVLVDTCSLLAFLGAPSSTWKAFFFFAEPHSIWDLSSPTRDWTHVSCIGRWCPKL